MNSSFPYVPGQDIIMFDASGSPTIIIDQSCNKDLLSDKSYLCVARLQEAIIACDDQLFKKIYESEYIANAEICDFFKFEKVETLCYSLCQCTNKNEAARCIHADMFVRPCCCQNGKRYLAYLCAFNACLKDPAYYYNTNEVNPREIGKITDIMKYLILDGPLDLTYKHNT
jgi:hypothetical protein